MKFAVQWALYVLAYSVAVYLGFAFIGAEPNPFAWVLGARFLYVVVIAMGACAIGEFLDLNRRFPNA